MHYGLSRWFGLAVLICTVALSGRAQPAPHTRVYRSAGTYPSIVSSTFSGQVVSKSGDSSVLTLLDGYTPRDVRMPEMITYRVQQSRSGQIWSATNDGLLLYRAGAWTVFSLPEIRAFLAEPSRHLRQIALLAAEVNHVLVLLPDRLLDFEVSAGKTRLLREARTTGLGEFAEIQEGFDDSIWISGTYGLAHVQGPVRHIGPESVWKEFLLPQTNVLNNLQRPFEGPLGEVISTANPAGAESRSIVRLRAGEWSSLTIPGEKIRHAWRAWDDQVWGLSTASLFRVHDNDGKVSLQRHPVSGAQYDVAVETNGVFWVASGEGLVRYAPYLWRTPPELEDVQSSVQSILLQTNGAIWLGTPAGLVWQNGKQRRTYPWPEEMENLPPRQNVFALSDGRIVAGGPVRPMLLNPATGEFRPLPTPAGARARLVGQLSDGAIIVWLDHPESEKAIDLRLWRGETLEDAGLPAQKAERGVDISFVKEVANGDWWIGLGSGLLRFRRSLGTVEHHGAENGLRTDRIYGLGELSDGRLWCGTVSRIYEFRGQRWEPILNTVERVTDIVSAGGSVWVSTLAGLHRFQENSWFIHGLNEGIPAGAVYALRIGADQQLWAATSRGAVVFHPDADREPPRTLQPRLEEEQTPSAGQPAVVHFRAQDKWDYALPPNLLFSYRLDEGSWTPFSNITSRVFHKLSAGAHLVEVLSMDRNGNKSLESSQIEFSVIVPWSSDPRLLSVLVMALVVTFIFAGLAVNRHMQLKRSYAEVEKIVEERTHDLNRATQELIHAQKMRALGTMAAGIAHDFNNILSIIKGSAQIIESNVDDKEKIRTRVGRIQLVVEQGSVIVKALLGLGKTGDRETELCDISQLLYETRKLLADRFPASVQIQINVPPGLPRVLCSPEVLQQILLNLILNAADAMHNDGVVELAAVVTRALPAKLVLEPETGDQGDPVSWVVISVVDEGGGIPPETLPRIFEPFFTTKAFSSRRGTGLGLSMVYELAKQLGYGIGVETRTGEGSTFSIVIPVRQKIESA